MLLGIDQGTSGTTCLALTETGEVAAQAYRPLASQHPQDGWVEQDPAELLRSVVEAVTEVLEQSGGRAAFSAAGLANQGESVVAWDARSGEALTPVVVWSDQRSGGVVEAVREQEQQRGEVGATERESGLRLSSYFSAPKLRWLLDHHPEVRSAARRGTLRLGTLEVWLGVRLGAGNVTDPSTASRTQLYSLDRGDWSPTLLGRFGIPGECLPTILPSGAARGTLSHATWGGAVPWWAGCVDQVAALLGCGCLEAGQVKVTYGTGAFVLANAGTTRPKPVPGLLCSVGLNDAHVRQFVLDGGVFTTGTAVNWLRRLGLLPDPAQASRMADAGRVGVRFLPALSGIGAPFWQPEARGVFSGLTEATSADDLVRAVLDGIAQRVADVIEAMRAAVPDLTTLRVDGGLSRIDHLLQRQADLTGLTVERAASSEATALGVALMAGTAAGSVSKEDVRRCLRAQSTFAPQTIPAERRRERQDWAAWRVRAAALGEAPQSDRGNSVVLTDDHSGPPT